MNRVQCVSLPRSGHNLLVTHLQKYFQPAAMICKKVRNSLLSFRQKSETPVSVIPNTFHYCEYYYACRCHPCTDAGNTFQKSHDFELQLPVDPAQKYLIQHRNTLDLLISWFELRLPKKREIDSADGFNEFLQRMQPYVDGFHQKWIQSTLPNRIVFDYEAYLNSPAEHLSQAIEFFDAELQLDTDRINQIVADVRPPKDNREFRFIDSVPERLCA